MIHQMGRGRGILLLVWALMSATTASLHAQTVNAPLTGAFVAAVPAAQDRIVLYDAGSGTQREIRLGEGLHNVWGFSPDGCQVLATLTDGFGLGRMVIANLDGSAVHAPFVYDELPVTQWGVWEPQWSPAGDRIVFKLVRDGFEGRSERQYHIVGVALETGEVTYYSRTGREHNPQWSPDGRRIVYLSFEDRVAGVDIFSTAEPTQAPLAGQSPAPVALVREADLWLVNGENANDRFQLTAFRTGSVSMPRWSPDGDLISFVHSPSGNNDTQWIIAAQQSAIPTQLTFNWNLALDVTWQPDSAALVATLRDFRGVADNQLWRLPLVGNADNESVRYLESDTGENPLAAFAFADYPRFSAAGDLLALRSQYRLVLLNVAAGRVEWVDDVQLGNTPPVWSPAGFLGEQHCITH